MSYSPTDKNLLKSLGTRVAALRRAKGWSQEHLSFETGLDRTYVSSVERGRRNISFLNLYRISRALEVDLSELLKDLSSDQN